jgi:hypothetical protein
MQSHQLQLLCERCAAQVQASFGIRLSEFAF